VEASIVNDDVQSGGGGNVEWGVLSRVEFGDDGKDVGVDDGDFDDDQDLIGALVFEVISIYILSF